MRSTYDHRAAVAAWAATAPAKDSDIFPQSRSSNPRHEKLSDNLLALLKWRALSKPKPEPLQTNWSIIPANDNNQEEDLSDDPAPPIVECAHAIQPSPEQLIRAVRDVQFAAKRDARGNIELLPVTGDIERRGGKIVRLGRIELGTLPTQADGTSTRPGNDRAIIRVRGRKPVDRFGRAKGADIDEEEEYGKRQRLAYWLGCYPGEFIPRSRESRKAAKARANRLAGLPNPPLPPTSLSLREARAWAGLPPAEAEEMPALPCGSMDVGNIFASWMVQPKSITQANAPDEDTSSREDVAAKLAPTDIAVLDAAMTARNMADIGTVIGFAGKVAERKGRQALLDACARLSEVLAAA